ncbi:MAG TPA: PaaI family thioesterase [Actinomycetota bacterium]
MSENRTPPGFTREQALATAREIGRGTFLERIELEWLEVGLDRLVARIPVAGNTQPYGILHGGATAALCETVGSFGTSIHVGLDRRPVGVQLSMNHLRAVREGHVTATGVPLHVGRTIALWEMRVEDDEGRLVAVGTLTLVIRDAVPG